MKSKTVIIACVNGDGAAPEAMSVAKHIAIEAANQDRIEVIFEDTPMGWNAYESYGDTLPPKSLKRVLELGIVFFGGVGTPRHDQTIGKLHPEMRPEVRCLMALRTKMGLLLNFRPVIYSEELKHLAKVKLGTIPATGIWQIFVRFLLQDSYFGNNDLLPLVPSELAQNIGLIEKRRVTGDEDQVAEFSYYTRAAVEKYFRAVFAYARLLNQPVVCIDKANIMARYDFWRKVAVRISAEFPDVPFSTQLVDSANALLFTPERLQGVIACGNEHGDILSDGAVAAAGSMGMMHSSAINPDTYAAMFESGAGTAPDLQGKNTINPLGRILTAEMMLRHIGATQGADAIKRAVRNALVMGYRTPDLFNPETDNKEKLVGTEEMGGVILTQL